MVFGPARGLELADALSSLPELRNYHLLPSVRADLPAKLGRRAEARAEFERVAPLTATRVSAPCPYSAPPRARSRQMIRERGPNMGGRLADLCACPRQAPSAT